MIARMISRPSTARTVRISRMLSEPARPRIATAMTENDRSVPVIHITTMRSWRGDVTDVSIPRR
jgi:hypothetical protein